MRWLYWIGFNKALSTTCNHKSIPVLQGATSADNAQWQRGYKMGLLAKGVSNG